MDKVHLIAILEDWRNKQGLTQTEISEKLGFKQGYYQKVIKRPNEVSLDKYVEIFQTLGIPFYESIAPISTVSKEDIEKVITLLDEQNKKYEESKEENLAIIEILKKIKGDEK